MKIDATERATERQRERERDLCVGTAGDRAWKINFQGFPGRRPVSGRRPRKTVKCTPRYYTTPFSIVRYLPPPSPLSIHPTATICEQARIKS